MDYLPKVKRVLLQEAKKCLKTELLNFKFVWATNGNIFAKKDEGSKLYAITSMTDLDKFKNL